VGHGVDSLLDRVHVQSYYRNGEGGYKASGSGAAIDDGVNLQHVWEYGAISPAGRKSRSDAIL
jgi:hypothetical protein